LGAFEIIRRNTSQKKGDGKTMPFANNQGIKIYYEVEGQGPPIILAHGATGNITFWTGYGYVDRLKDKYSVILLDARGHGKSDKPHEAENYDYRLMVNDVVAVLDSVGVPKAHYWGYSMGGYTGVGMAKYFPKRLLSLVLGGISPEPPSDKSEEPSRILKIFRQGVQEGIEGVVEGFRELAGSITTQYAVRLRGLDLQAMVALREYFQYLLPDQADDVLHIELPCLIYAGDDDDAAYKFGKEMAPQMPNGRFCSLPGLDHIGASDATEQIMPHVLSFLENQQER
jgi:pimeloyl-ACP methyl ester carboxylesterase